jgi:hypothetical protein
MAPQPLTFYFTAVSRTLLLSGCGRRGIRRCWKNWLNGWKDIIEKGIGSRVVLVDVPSGWGATTMLR